MKTGIFTLFGIKSMLSRDEMRKIKAGSGCTAVGELCTNEPDICPQNCVCDVKEAGGVIIYANCADYPG